MSAPAADSGALFTGSLLALLVQKVPRGEEIALCPLLLRTLVLSLLAVYLLY